MTIDRFGVIDTMKKVLSPRVSMRIHILSGMLFFIAALPAMAVVVYENDFGAAAGELTGQNGFLGRDKAICLDGRGVVGLGKGADGYVKRAMEISRDAMRVRITARVIPFAMADSVTRLHHISGEKPSWIAIGVGADGNPTVGLARAGLSLVVSSDGKETLIGLGKSVGRENPEFGECRRPVSAPCEVGLEYDFIQHKAAAFLNAEKVLEAQVDLNRAVFLFLQFQLRRTQPIGSEKVGGIDSICVEVWKGKVDLPPAKPTEPLASRVNEEAVRAKAIAARIDGAKSALETIAALKEGWINPPSTYRPHTRWWWPGNAVTKKGLDWQLGEMKDKGFGGTEPMSWLKVYAKGNIEFESPEFMEMMKYAVDKSRELGMFITPPLFPGWGHGGAEVKEEHRSKAMVISAADIRGGAIDMAVPLPSPKQPAGIKWSAYMANGKKRFDALVAVALGANGKLDPSRRVDLTSVVTGERGFAPKPKLRVCATLPEGRWRLMAFWTCFTGQKCAAENNEPRSWIVDHLSKEAVRAYLDHSGKRYMAKFAGDFGQTVDSFFGDSYELSQDFSYWSNGFFERFEKIKGYDLRPYLPLLLLDGAPETPYVRYDFGHFLHLMGMEGITKSLAEYCAKVGIQMRQQPHYRFTTELIEASGIFQRPETENTKRSFDPMFWHKLTTSGAELYPAKEKRWVSAEAFTFINANYRVTMEEIKRATDLFLRDGITQFYNHGYFYSPEKEIAPARDLIYMNRISHVNTWWPWYRGLADYQARGCFLSRQGRSESDVLVYSPMPTLWSERAEYPCKHVRDLPFGPLPKILVANGYDFDCANDDLLLHHATIKDGRIVINGHDYAVLVLLRAICLSPEILKMLERFVEDGGTVMALARLPAISTGLMEREKNDAALRALRNQLFAVTGGEKGRGKGKTWFFPDVEGVEYLKNWSPGAVEWQPTPLLSPAWNKFAHSLRSQLTPDFEIDGASQSDGLTFRHTVIGEVDCWFVTNLQTNRAQTEITLKTRGKIPQAWDAMTGEIAAVEDYRFAQDGRIILPVSLEPWESRFYLLTDKVDASLPKKVAYSIPRRTIPVNGSWQVKFDGLGGMLLERQMEKLVDWTTVTTLKDFSGTATYSIDVDLPADLASVVHTTLDLGAVHEVAAVSVNGTDAGKVWMQPYRVDVTGLVRPGKNRITITLANSMWNYCAGLKQPNPIPPDLHAQYGSDWKRNYNSWSKLQAQKKQTGNDRLPSGLIGPVKLLLY